MTLPGGLDPQEEMRAALSGDQLRLHYQPIIDLDSGRVSGVEALLRWEHPIGGLLLPDDFLPSIAHTPLMAEVTRWVLATACDAVRRWPGLGVSVNVSATDVSGPTIIESVRRALESSGLEPHLLTIELTEHAMIQDLPQAVRQLTELRALGLKLSLDDFGTGYSSLFYLRQMPISELKIDRVFVAGVGSNPEDAAIVRSVIRLARGIGVTVVAEGVEDAEQLDFLRRAGCGAAQGYLWGRPAPRESIEPTRVIRLPESRREGRQRLASPADPRTSVMDRIEEMLELGASLHTIAAALNREGVRTPKGTRWTSTTVAMAASAAEAGS